jgi:DNA-binding response OmpR family regulator
VAGERVDLVALQPELLPLDEVIAFCTSIQRRGGVWLAVISRQSDPHIAVELLHAGADCYLPLPMAPSVALAHLLAMVRRPPPALGDGLRPVTASWSLDEQARRLIGSNRMQRLSDLEYRLLLTLLDRPGAVMERPELLAAVWGPGYTNGRLVDQYVCYVRRKVEAEPSYPRAIITVGRAGYLYRPPERRPA